MPSRIVDIDNSMVMVVTDLHGDWPLYERYRDVFLHLFERGLVQTWVITGDFIHSNGPEDQDGSLNIVLDLMALREAYGDAVIALLGNHEMPHIYNTTLQRGDHVYTPRFEHALGDHRERVTAFLDSLPFFVRTPAGVTLCHAGAFPEVHQSGSLPALVNLNHQDLLNRAKVRLNASSVERMRERIITRMRQPYDEFVREYLAVNGPDDPRYDAYLLGQIASGLPEFDLLWAALFSRNEHAHDMATYAKDVHALLQTLSQGYSEQRVLVCGHIGARGGARVIANGQQLRLASGSHAYPYTAAKYLLFDAEKPLHKAHELESGLGSVFEG